jgi:hypothetical protein
MVAVVAAAVPGTAMVRMLLVPVADAGLNAAVTPEGNPPALRATAAVNPPVRVMVIVDVPLLPGLRVKLDGLAESAKSGAATVRLMVVDRVSPPPTPLMVTVALPRVAVVDAVSVSVELVPVAEAGLKAAVTPEGRAPVLSATLAVNPPVRVIVMLLLPPAPRLIVNAAGFAEREKSGVTTGLTITLAMLETVEAPRLSTALALNGYIPAATLVKLNE